MSMGDLYFNFPGGKIIPVDVADDGNGATRKLGPPTGKKWVVLGVWVKYEASDVVGNRSIRPTINKTGTTTIIIEHARLVCAGAATVQGQWTQTGVKIAVADLIQNVNVSELLSLNCVVGDLVDLYLSVSNNQLGDSWDATVWVLEIDAY